MKLEIEKNVPLPAESGRKSKYPFNEMEIGDSFFVPVSAKEEAVARAASIRTQFSRLKPKHFTVRISDNGSFGVRVWRDK